MNRNEEGIEVVIILYTKKISLVASACNNEPIYARKVRENKNVSVKLYSAETKKNVIF